MISSQASHWSTPLRPPHTPCYLFQRSPSVAQSGCVPNQTRFGSNGFRIGRFPDGTRFRWDMFRIGHVPEGTHRALKTRRCSGSDSESLKNKEVFRIELGATIRIGQKIVHNYFFYITFFLKKTFKHNFIFFFRKSGEASCLRVCY